MEFKAFNEIRRLDSVPMSITQKLHGTNAQIFIFETDGILDLKVGSRTRWITPESDNYGFAAFVNAHKLEFIHKLGVGQHFGEWVGTGINSTEGLTERAFVLFDFWKYPEGRPLPPQTKVVPVLYHGRLDSSKIDETLEDLKTNGSKLVAGFMKVEGVVVTIGNARYKKVFNAEETKWTGVKKVRAPKEATPDYSHILQPIRLEKLLSRDETYRMDYPLSLPSIVLAYVEDLIKEGQLTADEAETHRKVIANAVFPFVKTCIETNNFA